MVAMHRQLLCTVSFKYFSCTGSLAISISYKFGLLHKKNYRICQGLWFIYLHMYSVRRIWLYVVNSQAKKCLFYKIISYYKVFYVKNISVNMKAVSAKVYCGQSKVSVPL